ncbi:MAG: hypothetical protein HS106_11520 [Ideonella sp.]|nr:hypothetical protein [Ideonella sp.]
MRIHRQSAGRVPGCGLRLRYPGVLALCLMAALSWPSARAAPQATDDDTADCIAVMEVTAGELARQVKAGDKEREPALRAEMVRAAALVGSVYFDGMHDERTAKARLNEARERQKTWDDERRSRVHGACVLRADAELAAASGAERLVIEKVAEVRMRRMLRKP